MKSLVITLFIACVTTVASAQEYQPNEVYRSGDRSASVEDLGEGVYLFRLWPGFYVSPFLVGDGEVAGRRSH